jgi:hypothetical protein
MLPIVKKSTKFYTDAEKVALELTEHVTLVPTKRVPDDLYNRVRIVKKTM